MASMRDGERSISPGQLQTSCKDSSVEALPNAFRPRPRLSRTPPDTPTRNSATKILITIDRAMDEDLNSSEFETKTDDTYTNSKINSPSLSIEYPPGSLIAMNQKRRKFQFHKRVSHYQRFIGTSSAKKTKEIRKKMEWEKSRSCSLMPAHIDFDQISNHENIIKSPQQINQESLPPSPPSDDLIASSNQNKDNKPKQPIIRSKWSLPSIDRSASGSDESSELTVSSSPSLLNEDNITTQRTRINLTKRGNTPVTKSGYSFEYKSRTSFDQKPIKKSNLSGKSQIQSSHKVIERKMSRHVTFGSSSDVIMDNDEIRIALSRYEQQKGQNLHELFRPKKSCCNHCIIL